MHLGCLRMFLGSFVDALWIIGDTLGMFWGGDAFGMFCEGMDALEMFWGR